MFTAEKTLNNLATWKIADLPAGAVITGAAVGGVGDAATGLVRGFLPSAPSWAVKAGMAFLVAKYGKGILGTTGANVGALFLTYDAVQEMVDVRGKVNGIVSGLLSKIRPTTSLTTPVTQQQTSVF